MCGCQGGFGAGGSGGLTPGEEQELEVAKTCGNNIFWDDFAGAKPFWNGTAATRNDDWIPVNSGVGSTSYLEGQSPNTDGLWFWQGQEGDFDIIMDFDRQGASSCGIEFIGPNPSDPKDANQTSLKFTSSQITFALDGETSEQDAITNDRIIIRLQREKNVLTASYIENDAGNAIDPFSTSFIQLGQFSGANVLALGNMGSFLLDDANGGDVRIYEIWFCSNTLPHRINSGSPKVALLTDAATVVTDAALGNVFDLTLGGNRTMEEPVNNKDGQVITYRIRQDGTGSRTVTWANGVNGFRFGAAGAPTLSTDPDDLDYVSFMYNLDDLKWDFIGFREGFT